MFHRFLCKLFAYSYAYIYICKFFLSKRKSSSSDVSYKKGPPKNITKFTGKHLLRNLFLVKVPGWWPGTLSKRKLWHRCFLWLFRNIYFVEHLRTAASEEQPTSYRFNIKSGVLAKLLIVLQNSYSQKFHKIQKKRPVLETLF